MTSLTYMLYYNRLDRVTPEQQSKQLNLNDVQDAKPPIKMPIFKSLEGRNSS